MQLDGDSLAFSAQNLLQRLVFDHGQRFQVLKLRNKQTHKYSKKNKDVGIQPLGHERSVMMIILPFCALRRES